jgi:uncharacterized protein YbjT (DUF2867 family)
MTPRKVFVAGSTGATGRALLAQAERRGVRAQVVPHLRPRSATTRQVKPPPDAVIVDLADGEALARTLSGFTTVVQLIGTMRKRFGAGDTYETSDIGTTRQLCAAAARAGVDHIVLLSAAGTSSGLGAYYKAKAEAERLVQAAGPAFTIFRPSQFYGEGHRALPGSKAVMHALGLRRFEPIAVDALAAAILKVALERAPAGAILEGRSMWAVVEAA